MENEYIVKYKAYANTYLPQGQTLMSYWASDFEVKPVTVESLTKLDTYLKQLKSYTVHLTKAAALRQEHFERFINNQRQEDRGHKFWREGMNAIAQDATEKVEYWSETRQKLFDKAVIEYENYLEQKARRKKLTFPLYYENVDFDIKIKSKKVVHKPKLSNKEKKRRKRERAREKQHREKQETKVINIAISETLKEGLYHHKFHKFNAKFVSYNILYDTREHFFEPIILSSIPDTSKNLIPELDINEYERKNYELIGELFAKNMIFSGKKYHPCRELEVGILISSYSFCQGLMNEFIRNFWKTCPKPFTRHTITRYYDDLKASETCTCLMLALSRFSFSCIKESINLCSTNIKDEETKFYLEISIAMDKPNAQLARKIDQLNLVLEINKQCNKKHAMYIYNLMKNKEDSPLNPKVERRYDSLLLSPRISLTKKYQSVLKQVKAVFE